MSTTDRFIIDKSCYDPVYSHHLLQNPVDEKLTYRKTVQRNHLSFLLHGCHIDRMKVLNHTDKDKLSDARSLDKVPRKIKSKSERILEAPGIINDYYTSNLDWGYQDSLAVALDTSVYTWNTRTNKTQLLADYANTSDAYISCISWQPDTNQLAVTSTCTLFIDLWEETSQTLVRQLTTLQEQIISMSWNKTQHLLSCGAISGAVQHYDVRVNRSQPVLTNNVGEVVCGLKWSPTGTYLATGSNNSVKIWDLRQLDSGRFTLNNPCHTSAVKALAWCPWRPHLIASGGGICDQSVRIWSSVNGKEKARRTTGSQVTSLLWSEQDKELLSAHGKPQCSLQVWQYPQLEQLAELKMHDERILSAVMSPDTTSVAAASADETISIWNCFPGCKGKTSATHSSRDTSLHFALWRSIR